MEKKIRFYLFSALIAFFSLATLSYPVAHAADTETPAADKEAIKTRKLSAIQTMADLLKTKKPPKFFVVLFAYKIEGFRYMTSGLTVSEHHTHNLSRTPDGFECDALFPPELIDERTRQGARVQPNGSIKVRLSANHEDIHMIIMFKDDGSQSILYQ